MIVPKVLRSGALTGLCADAIGMIGIIGSFSGEDAAVKPNAICPSSPERGAAMEADGRAWTAADYGGVRFPKSSRESSP
jgi:hypothetical protein